MKIPHRPVSLIILDGWGYSESTEHNAIQAAHTPVWDNLWANCPHTLIGTSGAEVGLPSGQMGNSEVGHLNLGAGRVVYQEYTRVSRAIKTGSFFSNATLTDAVDTAMERGSAIHILGLLSPGGVHSHEKHILAMAELAAQRGASTVYVHAFLDGRDTPPKSASASIQLLEAKLAELGTGAIASVVGRYYAMDRDHRWPRVQSAFDAITQARAKFRAENAQTALQMAYDRGETDEFVKATVIAEDGVDPVRMHRDDIVIFMNYRSDRARQITRAFIESEFSGFDRAFTPNPKNFYSLTEYSADFDIPVAFPAESLPNVFGEYISNLGLRQLRIAETEKYAHVTFFFNGGEEESFDGEDRILIPSPNVATYDLQPEMSAQDLTNKLTAAISGGKYDVIICNYANPDMVGHTGKFEATVNAIEALDANLGRVLEASRKAGGELLVTADHGNAEQMQNEATGQAHTAHTTNPVPFIYVGRAASMEANGGALRDVAPTILTLLGLEVPSDMTGRSLVILDDEEASAA